MHVTKKQPETGDAGTAEFLYIYLPDVLNRWYKIKIGIRAEDFCFNIVSGVHLWRQH